MEIEYKLLPQLLIEIAKFFLFHQTNSLSHNSIEYYKWITRLITHGFIEHDYAPQRQQIVLVKQQLLRESQVKKNITVSRSTLLLAKFFFN